VQRIHPRVLVITVVIDAILSNAVYGQPAEPAEQVFSFWREREKRVETASFQWTETRTIPKGTVLFTRKIAGQSTGLKRDVTHDLAYILRLDRQRMYHSTDGPRWLSSEARFVSRKYVSVYNDGNSNRAFYGESDGKVHPIGFVAAGKKSQDWDNDHIAPVLMAYRPFHPEIGRFRGTGWKLLEEPGIVQGGVCKILERIAGERKDQVWVDPEREFVISRLLQYMSGALVFQLDMSYEKDANSWYPTRWTSMVFLGGRVSQSSAAIVKRHSLNLPLTTEDFAFEFPVGTEVVDRSRKESRLHYIIREDGEKRIITEEEQRRNTKYPDWLQTASGQAGRSFWRQWGIWLLGVILVGAGGVVAARQWLRRRNRRTDM
jgi:hypothetical protein